MLLKTDLRVLEKGTWLSEVKDVTRRFNPLPPIAQGNKVSILRISTSAEKSSEKFLAQI
jgi:hypothetical protein